MYLVSFWGGHNGFELEATALLTMHVSNVEVRIFPLFKLAAAVNMELAWHAAMRHMYL
jgi:hypothetical protein